MLIRTYTDPFPYLVIDDYFTDSAYAEVMEEIQRLKPLAGNADTARALSRLKTGTGVFLDEVYASDRSRSPTLALNRQIFSEEVMLAAESLSIFYRHIRNATRDCTLINYYHDGEEYGSHCDQFTISAVWFSHVGDIQGGAFEFSRDGVTIPHRDNTIVIFPGCVEHRAKPVYSAAEGYRVSMAQFLCYKQGWIKAD
jgi:2OG-Fe(II) oxygenase superfamily